MHPYVNRLLISVESQRGWMPRSRPGTMHVGGVWNNVGGRCKKHETQTQPWAAWLPCVDWCRNNVCWELHTIAMHWYFGLIVTKGIRIFLVLKLGIPTGHLALPWSNIHYFEYLEALLIHKRDQRIDDIAIKIQILLFFREEKHKSPLSKPVFYQRGFVLDGLDYQWRFNHDSWRPILAPETV